MALSREEILQIQKTAAPLLLDAGYPDEAAAFFLDAGDWKRFVPFVLNHAPSLKRQGRIKTLGQWLGAIPAEIAGDSPCLLHWTGQSALAVTPAKGLASLEQAFELFNEQGDDTGALLTWIGLVDAMIFGFEDLKPLDRWIDWLDARMIRDPSFPSLEIEADIASIMVVALLWRRPNRMAMQQWIDRALMSSRAIRDSTVRILALRRALHYSTWMGDRKACLTLLDELARMTISAPAHPVHLIADRLIKANYCAWVGDDSELAMKLVEEGLALAEKTGIHILDPFLAMQGATSACRKRDDSELLKYIGKLADSHIQGSGYAGFYNQYVAHRNVLLGKFAEAQAFAAKSIAKFRESGMPFGQAWSRLLISQSAHELGDIPLAEKVLNAFIRFFQQAGSAYGEFSAYLFKAYHLLGQKRADLGMETLGQAMRRGRQNGYTNAWVYQKQILSVLCAKALEAGIEVEYAREFVRKAGLAPPSPTSEAFSGYAIIWRKPDNSTGPWNSMGNGLRPISWPKRCIAA